MVTGSALDGAPFFSIVMPVFNRRASVVRGIASCLAQTDGDFELLVVDDASTDGSQLAVDQFADPRIRRFQHEQNRGPCPARNTAIAEARGTWCVMVDSDFALRAHALATLKTRALSASPYVGNLASSCQWDNGRISPPLVPSAPMDFRAYVEWLPMSAASEKLDCIRRTVFDDLRYANSRAWEFEFHLDVAARWLVDLSRVVLVDIYTDAPNRLTADHGPSAVDRVLADAPDKFASFEGALSNHVAAIDPVAPALASYMRVLAGSHAVLCGDRARARQHARELLSESPLNRAGWSLLALSLLRPRTAAWVMVQRRRALARAAHGLR